MESGRFTGLIENIKPVIHENTSLDYSQFYDGLGQESLNSSSPSEIPMKEDNLYSLAIDTKNKVKDAIFYVSSQTVSSINKHPYVAGSFAAAAVIGAQILSERISQKNLLIHGYEESNSQTLPSS
jgi:hypothetical protein